MTEMIERVARAIFAAKSQTHTTWEQCDWGYRTMKMKEARAAIEALREPTEGMVKAADRRNDDNDDEEATLANWQAMIDEALK